MVSMSALLVLTVVVFLVHFGQSDKKATAQLVPLEANADTLVYLQVAWRHGDRTPATSVPFNDASAWEEGLGELTRKGIAIALEVVLRARIWQPWFWQSFRTATPVFVRSSDYNRTIMSAQANMAGLFPPSKSEMWEDNLPWQPVPVHSVPRAIDKELYEDISCPTANEEFSTLWRSEVVKRMEIENEDFIEFLKEKTKIPNFEFRKLWMVFDNLFCMKRIIRCSFLTQHDNTLQTETALPNVGPLLKDIIERFEAKVNGVLGDKPKLYAYSAHDTTLAAMLSAMGIFPEHFPRYSSAVLLELHRKNGQLIVEVYYKNVTDVDSLYHYNIPGCEDPCTLDAFKSAMNRYLPVDWNAECGIGGPNVKNYMISTAVLALTTLLLAGVLIVDVVLKRKRRFSVVNNPLMLDEEEP
ncbi:histidine acid phosphatase [Ostertagia ostertagi]